MLPVLTELIVGVTLNTLAMAAMAALYAPTLGVILGIAEPALLIEKTLGAIQEQVTARLTELTLGVTLGAVTVQRQEKTLGVILLSLTKAAAEQPVALILGVIPAAIRSRFPLTFEAGLVHQ